MNLLSTSSLVAATLWLSFASLSHAATVVIDFNDFSTGNLSGQSGGIGTSGNWGGSTDIDVVAGNLTAPVLTNYGLTQSGTAQSLQGSGTSARKANVALSTALTGDTIWGSFLVNLNGNTSGRGGIQFNTASVGDSSPADPRIFALGTSVEGWLVGNTGAEVTAAGSLTASDTGLVLFKIDVSDIGNDAVTLWLNPDVNNLGAGTISSSVDWIGAGGITTISAFSYNGAFPVVDAIRLSDEANAFALVTGAIVPEPSAYALLSGMLALGWMVVRRRRA